MTPDDYLIALGAIALGCFVGSAVGAFCAEVMKWMTRGRRR